MVSNLMILVRIHAVFWSLLMLFTGYFLGSFVLELQKAGAPMDILVLPKEISKYEPVVHIKEINRGQIIGFVGTGTRLVIGDSYVVPGSGGIFRIAAAPFLVNIIDIPIPAGAQFVASPRGTKYYPVESKAWRGWKSQPVFFMSAGEAENNGYEPASIR